MSGTPIAWNAGTWTRPPAAAREDGSALVVTAEEGSDFWRETSYGFVHDNGHALLVDFPDRAAAEVGFVCDYDQQFDQAGLFVVAGDTSWVKSAVEFCDGAPQAGAVVTNPRSDWSLAPCPDWFGREVTVRASRSGDALTLRARADGDWQLLRVVPIDPGSAWRVGPLVNAPLRAGLTVRFTGFRLGPPDAGLHP